MRPGRRALQRVGHHQDFHQVCRSSSTHVDCSDVKMSPAPGRSRAARPSLRAVREAMKRRQEESTNGRQASDRGWMLRWATDGPRRRRLGSRCRQKTLIRSKAIYRNLREAAAEGKTGCSVIVHKKIAPDGKGNAVGALVTRLRAGRSFTPALLHSGAMSALSSSAA